MTQEKFITKEEKIQETVLEKIRCNEITMRPKFYHFMKVVVFILVTFLILVISVFIFSFILFSIRASSQLFLLGFGLRGIVVFFVLFPWFLCILDIVLICVLELLLRHFRFGYRRSAIYLLGGILVVMISLGFLLERVRFHEGLLDISEHHRLLFPLGEMYAHTRALPAHEQGLCRCVITAISVDSLILRDDDSSYGTTTEFVVALPLSFVTDTFVVGDRVFVAGTVIDGKAQAFGIQKMK